MKDVFENYLQKRSFCPRQISAKTNAGVGIIVVIPCFSETGLISSLESLRNCEPPHSRAEVIVVINASENSPAEIIHQNEQTFAEAKAWIEIHRDESLEFFLIMNNSLPQKHAGVGLARKIGMDEAAYRFAEINKSDGVIVCFDADATCDKNYLVEIERHFNENRKTPGCSIYFEHPVEKIHLPEFSSYSEIISNGIIQYELFLRYYRQGLKFAGHPFAFHTVGSSMAVKAGVYCLQGGMNKKKAGEDFYFLQKIFPLGHFSEINSTRVIPSPRPSLRVPFGTGKAISDFMKGSQADTRVCDPQTFADLKIFLQNIPKLYKDESLSEIADGFPIPVEKFLKENDFENQVLEIRKNSSSPYMFVKRFFRWFDGFRVLKFTHFARDNFYGEIPVKEAACRFLEMKGFSAPASLSDPLKLLKIYRETDKKSS